MMIEEYWYSKIIFAMFTLIRKQEIELLIIYIISIGDYVKCRKMSLLVGDVVLNEFDDNGNIDIGQSMKKSSLTFMSAC